MKYKLTIWHHLKDEVSANSMCEELRSKEFTNIKIVWVRSHFGLKDNFDFKHVGMILDLVDKHNKKKICLPNGVFVQKIFDEIVFYDPSKPIVQQKNTEKKEA